MKYNLSYHLLSLVFMMASLHAAFGQPEGLAGQACQERVILYTDRNVYIAGENVCFSACLFCLEGEGTVASRVLYCELITPDGTRVSEAKFEITGGKVAGNLGIPLQAISGIYYLKAYTRLMRNEGPGIYNYTQVMIINPDSREVLPPDEGDTAALYGFNPEPSAGDSRVILTTDSTSYHTRAQVRVALSRSPGMADSLSLSCISVAPAPAFSMQNVILPVVQVTEDAIFWPEPHGVALTGQLQDKATGHPLPNALVNLSVMGEKDMMASLTDSSGRFYFDITGTRGSGDVFLSSEKIPGTEPSILVDNDFCTRAVSLPSPPLNLGPDMQEMVEDMVMNCRIDEIFYAPGAQKAEPDATTTSFYGSPKEVIRLDKYIELPTLEEYFNELPSQVKVRKTGGKKHFRFSSTQSEMVIYDPLVLIDWVAVEDIDRILAMPPREIERIELINAPYVKGQMIYGGVINFISRKNDFAGIDLPESGIFIHYDFLSPSFIMMEAQTPPDHMPIIRNTLFWDPDLPITPTGKADFSFIAPDNPGEYLILFRGTDRKGNEIMSSARIQIR